MTTDLLSPLDRARARLRAALLAGAPTAPHRAAVANLETAARAAQERQAAAAAEAAAEHAVSIKRRIAEISGEMEGRLAATLARFPLPDETSFTPLENPNE